MRLKLYIIRYESSNKLPSINEIEMRDLENNFHRQIFGILLNFL